MSKEKQTETVPLAVKQIDSKLTVPTPLKSATEVSHDDEETKAAKKMSFPGTLAESLALLQKTKAAPDSAHRKETLKQLPLHIAKLQGGLPVIHTNANAHAVTNAARYQGLKRTKLDILSRQHPEVKSLLQDLETAEAKLAAAEKQLKHLK